MVVSGFGKAIYQKAVPEQFLQAGPTGTPWGQRVTQKKSNKSTVTERIPCNVEHTVRGF